MVRIGALMLLVGSIFIATGAASSERPNVIVMVADDLGWADVGFHGNQVIETPSLDRIAAEGTKLNRFYTTPICSPTRAALMTGRDPIRLGVAYSTIMPWHNNGIHPEETFLPELFAGAGYQTAMVGKWHLGHAQQTYHPNSRGFEHFYGHLHTEVGFFPPFASLGGKDFQRNGLSIDDQGYESYLLADEVSRYIRERDADKPFFIYMPFIAPHTPLDAPEDLKAKYADMEDDRGKARSKMADNTRFMAKVTRRKSARPIYAAVVDGMDQAIGRVLDTLDTEGLTDNTIVLFFSDNGGAVYAMGGADNAPLRGGKGDTFEGGIRVVATMRWPEKITPSGEVESIISVMDVFPTLLAAAGIEPTTRHRLDGRNLLPAIVDGENIVREDLLFFIAESPFKNTVNVAAFNDEWKLVQRIETGFTSVEVSNFLFDLNADPNEYQNLALEHPDVVAELADEIRHWRNLYPVAGTRSELMPPPGWRAPLDWADYPLQGNTLQSEPSGGMPPESAIRMLDWQYGENGRLIYNCEPYRWAGGGLCRSQ